VAHGHPVLARVHEAVQQRGLDLAVERGILEEGLDGLDAALADRDLHLHLFGQDLDPAAAVAPQLQDPVHHLAEQVGLTQLARAARQQRLQAHVFHPPGGSGPRAATRTLADRPIQRR
jgi:hypothetical protein